MAIASDEENFESKIIKIQEEISTMENNLNSFDSRISNLEEETANNLYKEVLVKTNEQLNLYQNPLAWLVSALAVLFTAGAIIASFLIYRQSKEYKEQTEKDRQDYKKQFEKDKLKHQEEFNNVLNQIKEKNELIMKEKQEEIDSKIAAYTTDLQNTKDEQKNDIEQAINDLKTEKLSIASTLSISEPVTVTPFNIENEHSFGFMQKIHKCSKCGYGFMVNGLFNSVASRQAIRCPQCGNTDEYLPF